MSAANTCPQCGATLSGDGPAGACPACLIELATGVASQPADHPANAATKYAALLTEGPGTVIGRYKLLEQLGVGGFGAVYVAEQREPVKRRVAIKVIKPGMDSQQVIARFEAERQALALMDHP